MSLFTHSEDDECTRRNISVLCYLLEINMFKAVLYFLFKFITNTAVPQSFIKDIRQKYDESTFLSVRQLERLTQKYEKSKCDIEYLRLCLIYNVTPKFVRFKLWKNKMKSDEAYRHFQRHCIQTEYRNPLS